jgi:hypothetical protein
MCIRSLLNAEVDMHISVLQSLDKKLDTSRRGQGQDCICCGWFELLRSGLLRLGRDATELFELVLS